MQGSQIKVVVVAGTLHGEVVEKAVLIVFKLIPLALIFIYMYLLIKILIIDLWTLIVKFILTDNITTISSVFLGFTLSSNPFILLQASTTLSPQI